MNDEMNQAQSQDVKFHTTPIHKVKCEQFENDITKRLETRLKCFTDIPISQLPIINELRKAQEVEMLIHEGKVNKVFCNLNENGICKSSKNTDKKCYLEDK